MKRGADIPNLDQARQLAGPGGFDLAAILTQLGGDQGRPGIS